MYIFSIFVIIALCHYITIASKSDANNTVDLDINARMKTTKIKVRKTEDGNVVIYRIEPMGKYKICNVVDGSKIVYEPMQGDETYKRIVVRCFKTDDEPVLVTLYYSKKCCGMGEHHYFRYGDGWRKTTDRFYDFVVKKMKNGETIDREAVVKEYDNEVELSKRKVEVDISTKETTPSSGVYVTNGRENGVDMCIYSVNNEVVMSTVKSGSTIVWERIGDEVYGCYEARVYFLGTSPELLILTINDQKGSNDFYYYKDNQYKFSQIYKDEFDNKMIILIRKSKRLIELDKNKVIIDIAFNTVTKDSKPGVTENTGIAKKDGISTRILTVDQYSVIIKVVCVDYIIWQRDGDEVYGCYNVKVYYLEKSPELLILTILELDGYKDLYYTRDKKKYLQIEKEEFDEKLKGLDNNTNQIKD